MKYLVLLLIGFVLCVPCFGNTGAASLQPNDRVVFAGDSITFLGAHDPLGEGWSTLFTQVAGSVVPGLITWNSGVPGNTSRDLVARFSQTVLNVRPSVVVIWIGINDIDGIREPFGYVPHKTHKNIEAMINACLTVGVREVILVSPMGRGERRDGLNPLYDEPIDALAHFLHQIAKDDHSGHIFYLPMRGYFLLSEARYNPQGLPGVILRTDGLHPSPHAGENFIYQAMLAEFGLTTGELPSP